MSKSPCFLKRSVLSKAAALFLVSATAHAADYTWTGPGTTWNTTSTNWDQPTLNPWDALNGGTNKAIFAGATVGTINLGAAVFANALQFDATGYTIANGGVPANTLTLAGTTPTVTTGTGVNATISAVVAGTNGLTKTGAGTLTLSGVNTYTGTTSVSQGTLKLDFTGRTGASGTFTQVDTTALNVSIASGATLELTNGSFATNDHAYFNNASTTFAGSGTINKTGAGYLRITGNLSGFTGLIDVKEGILGNNGTSWATGPGLMDLNIASGAIFDMRLGNIKIDGLTGGNTAKFTSSHNTAVNLSIGNNNGNATFNGTINNGSVVPIAGGLNTGVISLTKNGTGTQTLTGASTYTGATTVNGGILDLASSTTTAAINASSALTLGGGTLRLNSGTATTQTFAGLTTTAATGSAVVTGSGKTINLGGLTSNGAASAVNFNTTAGGTINLTGQTAGNVINTNFTVTDATGFGLATVNASNNVIRLAGTSLPGTGATSPTNYSTSGNLTVTTSQGAGSITADTTGGAGLLTLDPGVTLSNNTWNFGGNGSNTYGITGGTGLTSVAADNTINFNNYNTGTVTIGSAIVANGANAVNFLGTGNTILTGVNTYTGTTTIAGGTLEIGVAGSLNSGTYAGGIAINTGSTLKYNSSATQALSGAISGGGRLIKDGASTLTLNTANTYTGETLISTGILKLSSNGNLNNTSKITINSGATLDINAGTRDVLMNGNRTAGELVINGTLVNNGTLESRLFPATITMNNGTITCNLTGSPGDTIYGSFLVDAQTGNRTITANGASNLINGTGAGIGIGTGTALTFDTPTVSDGLVVSASLGASSALLGSLKKSGAGTVTLTGNNTYSGGTTITGGTLQIGNGAVNGTIGAGAYAVGSGATLYLNYATAATPTWSNISGAGTVRLNSAQAVNGTANWGTVALGSGFTGTLQVDNGRITAVPAGFGGATSVVLNNGSQGLFFDGTSNGTAYTFNQNFSINGMGWGEGSMQLGALRVAGMAATFAGNINLTGNSGLFIQNYANGSVNVSGVISGGFNLSLNNVLATGPGITLSGANTYTGETSTSGLVTLANSLALQNSTLASGPVTFSQTVGSHAFTFGGIKGSTNLSLRDNATTPNAVALTVGNNGQDTTYSGVFSGSGSLTKSGNGTLTLSSASSYTGGTTVTAGTLTASVTGALGATTGTLAVNGGILNLGSTTHTVGAVTLGGGTIQTGTLTGSSYASTGGLISANLGNTSAAFTQTSGITTLSGDNAYTGGTTVNGGTLNADHVNALGTGTVTVNGGTLALGATNIMQSSIALDGGTLTGTGYTKTVNFGGNASLNGTFSGTVNLLNNAATLTGSIGTLNSGTSASTLINTEGGLSVGTLGGQGNFAAGAGTGSVTVTTAHNPGNSPGTQTFDNLSYADNVVVTLQIAPDGSISDVINVNGTLTIGTNVDLNVVLDGAESYSSIFWDSNRSFNLISTAGTTTGSFEINYGSLGGVGEGTWAVIQNAAGVTATWTAVPEPSEYGLIGAGALAAVAFVRRRRRHAGKVAA